MEYDVQKNGGTTDTKYRNIISRASNEGHCELDTESQIVFSTPIDRESDKKIPCSDTQKVDNDSGFSDRHFDSAQPSQQLSAAWSDKTCRRTHSLPDCEFSPIQRDNHLLRARRLKFNNVDKTSLQLQALFDSIDVSNGDSSLQEYSFDEPDGEVSDSNKLCKASDSTDEDHSLFSKGASVSLVEHIFLHESGSNSNSSSSSVTDQLEASLQEMSLEENSSSSSSSPSFAVSRNFFHAELPLPQSSSTANESNHRALEDVPKEEKRLESGSDFDATNTIISTSPSQCNATTDSLSLSKFGLNQQEFLKKLSLTRKAGSKTLESQCLNHTTTSDINSLETSFSPKAVILMGISSVDKPTTCDSSNKSAEFCTEKCLHSSTDVRVPKLPHQYSPSDKCNSHETSAASSVTIEKTDEEYLAAPVCNHECFKSPSKRSGSDQRGQEFMLLRSPSKVRKVISESERFIQSGKVARSPCKSNTKKILKYDSSEIDESSKVSNVSDPHESRPHFLSIASDNNHFKDDEGRILIEKPLSALAPSINSDLRHFKFRSKSELSYLTPDHSCRRSAQKLEQDTVFMTGTHTGPLEDGDHHETNKLGSVISKFSPREPTRLIGRHIGLKHFDIVRELSIRNFLLCVQKIFQHLQDTDLVSVCRVSNTWKWALLRDIKSYPRYRMFRSQHFQRVRNLGKENCRRKSQDVGTAGPGLTASKGHLTAIQMQASVLASQLTLPQSSLALLSEDQLRSCPLCQSQAREAPHQDRATCTSEKCGYDFCTQCFAPFHCSRRCKPLFRTLSKNDLAGTRKSRKNLRRL